MTSFTNYFTFKIMKRQKNAQGRYITVNTGDINEAADQIIEELKINPYTGPELTINETDIDLEFYICEHKLITRARFGYNYQKNSNYGDFYCIETIENEIKDINKALIIDIITSAFWFRKEDFVELVPWFRNDYPFSPAKNKI